MINEQTNSIISIKKDFEDYKNKEVERKIEIKKDLLVEIAPKADIQKVNDNFIKFYQILKYFNNGSKIAEEININNLIIIISIYFY